jgi:peptidoglycan/LPS O-acetylase OafA/YrhL
MSISTIQKPLLSVAIATALLLLIPAAAMQFTTEVAWGPGDFVAAAVLIFGAGAAIVMSRSHVRNSARRALLATVIALCFALVWAELAVGLFD